MEKVYKYKRKLFVLDDSICPPNIKITLNGTKRYGYVGIDPLSDGRYTWTRFDSEVTDDGIILRIQHHERFHKDLKKTINKLCKELLDDNQYDEEMILREEHRQTARHRISEFMDAL